MDQNKKLFPQRLWELVHDEKYDFCLRWSPDGQKIYLNRNEFETHYLRTPSNQFHTKKAISFVRQMNMYGFRKVDDCYYENDNFKRNCHHLLKNMVRRHSNKPPTPPTHNNNHHHLHQDMNFTSSSNNLDRGCSLNDGQNCHHGNIHDNNGGASNNFNLNSGTTSVIMNTNNSGLLQRNQEQVQQAAQLDQPLAPIQLLYRQFTGLNSSAFNDSSNHQVPLYLNNNNNSNDEPDSVQQQPLGAPLSKVSHIPHPSASHNSTLYQRLAALNFGARGESGQLRDENPFQEINSLPERNTHTLGFGSTMDLAQQMTAGLQQMNSLNLTADHQQTLAARQAAVFQRSLVGSLLRFTQPRLQSTVSSLEDNLLTSLRQQSTSMMLNHQLPFDHSDEATAYRPLVESQQPSMASTESARDADGPLELVVDSPRSSSSSNQQNLNGQSSSSDSSTYDRSNDFMFNLTSQSNTSGPSMWNSPSQPDDNFVDEEEKEDSFCSNEDDDDDLRYEQNVVQGGQPDSSFPGSTHSRPRTDFDENMVLNLAKCRGAAD